MLRSKLLVKSFATYNQILPKARSSPSVFSSDIASFGCLPSPKLLLHTRNNFEGFKKLQFIANISVVGSGEKFFSKLSNSRCWKCEQNLEVKNFACVACGALQHPKKNLNYFELFGLSQTFDINLEDLSKKFKKLQTIFHPDKFAGKTKTEKDISETYSKLVNTAYSTLKDPFRRGMYLLALQQYSECDVPLDQEFLKTVMNKNEDLEFLSNEPQIEKFLNSIRLKTEEYLALINQAFKSGNFPKAKHNLSKLNYYVNISNRAKEKLNELQEKKSS